MRSWCVVCTGLMLLASGHCASGADWNGGPSEHWLGELMSDRVLEARRAAMEEPLATDRPDFTEASSVVGWGVAQLESGYTYTYRDDRDGSITHTHGAPEFLWRIGIHEEVELRIIWNYAWERSIDAGAVSSPQGAEDMEVGFKFALFEQSAWRPETALVTHLVVPTGAEEFRVDDPLVNFNLLYGWDLPDEYSLAGSTGFGLGDEDVVLGLVTDRDGYGVFHQSVTVGIPLTEAARMYLEYFGLYSVARNANFPENYVNGGVTYLISNDIQLDVRAGAGLNGHADDFFTGTGLSLRF